MPVQPFIFEKISFCVNKIINNKIIPVSKNGDKADICNQRAITIVNSFANIFETALQDVIYFHVNRLLSPNKPGFSKETNTITHLLLITQYVDESMDDK